MKKHLKPGSIQSNKFISDLPEKRLKIEASIAFRNNALESAKRTNYQLEYDRLHGLKDLNHSLIRTKVNDRNKIKNDIDKLNVTGTRGSMKEASKLKKTLAPIEHEQNIIAQNTGIRKKNERTSNKSKDVNKGK